MICIAGTGYIFVGILLGYTVKQLIRKKKYSLQKGGAGAVSGCALSGILGWSVARIFLKGADNGTAMGILCMFLFFLSYLSLIGIVNIFKYQYIAKHPEILDGVKPTMKEA